MIGGSLSTISCIFTTDKDKLKGNKKGRRWKTTTRAVKGYSKAIVTNYRNYYVDLDGFAIFEIQTTDAHKSKN